MQLNDKNVGKEKLHRDAVKQLQPAGKQVHVMGSVIKGDDSPWLETAQQLKAAAARLQERTKKKRRVNGLMSEFVREHEKENELKWWRKKIQQDFFTGYQNVEGTE